LDDVTQSFAAIPAPRVGEHVPPHLGQPDLERPDLERPDPRPTPRRS